MAAPNVIRGTQVLIKVGDGADPEVFAHPCLINTERGVQFASGGNAVIVPDCANPDDPAWEGFDKDGLSCTITGAGTLDLDQVAAYDAWFRSPNTKNVQAWLSTHGYWQGAFHLTEFQVTGERGNKAQVSISMRNDGEVAAYNAS